MTSQISPQRILVIYDNRLPPKQTRNTILEHLYTMEKSDVPHDITYYNTHETVQPVLGYSNKPFPPPRNILDTEWDVVILHYTFLGFRTIGKAAPYWKQNFDWIERLHGVKIAIPQDEGNYAGVLDQWLFDWDVKIIFSVHYQPDGLLYPLMSRHAVIYPCLPGYIDEASAEIYKDRIRPISDRQKDIVYRVRKLPYWLGSASYIKWRVGEVVALHAEAMELKTDICVGYEHSLFGNDWLEFISSGKAVIGAEGGYSVINWNGELPYIAETILKRKPGLSFMDFKKHMFPGWDCFDLLTITPRHFEAITAKTCQVLVEGDYKGILHADEHYIPISEDYSNVDEALEKLKDINYIQAMVDHSYENIFLSGKYTYGAFASQIETALLEYQHDSETQPRERKARRFDMTRKNDQRYIDTCNAKFWNELCGTSLAQALGINKVTPQNLIRYDKAYMNYYPYLAKYVDNEEIRSKKTLEIGLGYGTLGHQLAKNGADYFGLDIAEGPL